MRTRAIVSGFLLAVGLLVWFTISSCRTVSSNGSADTKHNVVIEDGGIGILIPGTEISKEDGDNMNAILKKHDKKIYKLQTYRNGQLVKTTGSLKDLVLDQELISAMAVNVKKAGFAQFAIQLGIGHNPQRVVTSGPAPTPVSSSNPQRINSEPSATPTGGGVTHAQQIRESRELVTELKPILDTYKNK